MEEVKVRDNSFYERSYFKRIPNLSNYVLNQSMERLVEQGVIVFPEFLRESEDIDRDHMLLATCNSQIKTGNVMGFIGLEKERLVIESRFSIGENDYLFQYLLEKVLDIPNIINLDTEMNNKEKIINLLMFIFPYYLKKAMRKGIYKTYIKKSYNDANLKGSLDILKHIKRNTPFLGKIAYTQREFSYDNDMTQLIRHTIEYMKNQKHSYSLLKKVTDEVSTMIRATESYSQFDRINVIISNKKKPIRHAYYSEYRELQRICLMILQNQSHQIGTGQDKIHGLLFDGAWLWEEYINSLIGEQFYHPMNKGGNGAQRLFSDEREVKQGLIYPDFIGHDNFVGIIADAKYKPIENIGNKDYLQVLAYMFRFRANEGYYFYPEKQEKAPMTLYLNQGNTYEKNVQARLDIKIVKQGLKIPSSARNYAEFKELMKNAENEFLNSINLY